MKFICDKMKEDGTTEQLVCPYCSKMVNMKIFKSTTSFNLFKVSLLKLKVEYIILCPSCGAVFSLDKSAVKIMKGKTKDITEMCKNKLTFVRNIK